MPMKKDVLILIRVSAETRELIRRRALKDKTTMSEVVRRAVESFAGEKPNVIRTGDKITIHLPLHSGKALTLINKKVRARTRVP